MFVHEGRIIRPTQDRSKQYGGAIILCRVDTLTESSFCQSIIGTIRCGSRGCHTYNSAGGTDAVEVIDTFGRQHGLREIAASLSSIGIGG
jgi:hypothetical protein